jgi:hypothetical protein
VDEFLKNLQDPTTREGFWNLFSGLWGVAQSQPGFNYKDWLAVKDYIKSLEEKVDGQQAAVRSSGDGKKLT